MARSLDRPIRPWREFAQARELSRRAVRRARLQLVVLLPLAVGVVLVVLLRDRIAGAAAWDPVVRVVAALALIILGWQVARDIGQVLGPVLLTRLDPGTAGTVGFLIRLGTMLLAVIVALRIAQVDTRTLAVGGAFTAVVVGLAAQQTLGNLIAGTVLVSARPFRVGDRVRLQGGGLAGSVEGVVSSLGLLYTILARGDDAILVPNSVVLSVAVQPLREPTAVELRARLRPGLTPLDVQRVLEERITTQTRGAPSVVLEEFDGDEVVVRVTATPLRPSDGPQLASEVLEAIAGLTVQGTG